MRVHRLASWLSIVALAACTDQTLTGPDAQAAFDRAVVANDGLPHDVLIFIDGVQVTRDWSPNIESLEIESIEVVKGSAAVRLYGPVAERGVIHVRTKSDTVRPDA